MLILVNLVILWLLLGIVLNKNIAEKLNDEYNLTATVHMQVWFAKEIYT